VSFNNLVIAPGNRLLLGGPEGGKLIMQPTGLAAGQMSRTDQENRVWSLLREPGPDQGYPPPQRGDFAQGVVDRDLNIALAQFISATGIAPALSERRVDLPVFVDPNGNGDYPVPPDLAGLMRIEYTLQGQPSYKLRGLDFNGWDDSFGYIQNPDTGQPFYYRKPFAGYVRLEPKPGLGNAVGHGFGTIIFSGGITAGQTVTVTLSNGVTTVVVPAYIVQPTDTLSTIAFALSNLINASAAVQGPTAFYAPTSTSQNTINLVASSSPGTGNTYLVTLGGAGLLIASPTATTHLSPGGDTITFYYTSLGTIMSYPGDTPGIPPQYHIALVYRVLADYWLIKQDEGQADRYMAKFNLAVKEAKAYVFDSDQSTQPGFGFNEDGANWDQLP
jgi:hypothetical protein